MKGVLTVAQQLAVLSRIWGNDREGFVFLPWIDGRSMNKEERRKSYHEGPAFEWPAGKADIERHLTLHDDDDVYFAPCLFVDKKRIEQAAEVERSLWADLDESDPRVLRSNVDYRPSIAWESSPGRFQGVWLLDRPRTGLSWAGRENHRLTMHLGADPSGWDTTQLLRVPGRKNFKWEYKATNGGGGVQGELLWDNGPRYTVDDFAELPVLALAEVGDVDLVDEELVGKVDRHDVWARVRLKVTGRVREYMAFRKPHQVTTDMDRSAIQWQIMRELADAGCTTPEIIAIVRPTVWNSYVGRSDELKRLKVGAAKAVAEIKREHEEDDGTGGGALEVVNDEKPQVRWLYDVMATRMRRPRWLVHNVWSQAGCGFIAGDPKSYKSWMGLDLAVSVATGTPFLGDSQFSVIGGSQPMLYLQEEDSEIVVRDRLDAIVEGKCPHLHWDGHVTYENGTVYWSPSDGNIPLGFHVRTGFVASDPGWQVWLAETLQDGKFAGVIVDTLGTTAGDVDTDRAQDLMTKILKPLREVSTQTGAAITVVHHNRKGSGGERGGQRMLGSVALHAWVDDALYVHTRETKPGGVTKVRVERESKASTEHRWTVEVPRMGIRPDGTRTVWEPSVGLWDTTDAVTGDTDVPTPKPSGTGSGKANHLGGGPGSRPAGVRVAGTNARYLVEKLGGGNSERPIPVARIAEVMGTNVRNMRKQVNQAIANKLLAGDIDTGVWIDLTRA